MRRSVTRGGAGLLVGLLGGWVAGLLRVPKAVPQAPDLQAPSSAGLPRSQT